MRLITCASVGVPNDVDMRKLLSMQCEDGSWEGGCLFRFGTTGLRVCNRGLTTALAVKAVILSQPRPLSPVLSPSEGSRPLLEVPRLHLEIPVTRDSKSGSSGPARPPSPFLRTLSPFLPQSLRFPWRHQE